jgi:hypothetical protein
VGIDDDSDVFFGAVEEGAESLVDDVSQSDACSDEVFPVDSSIGDQ